MKIMVAIPCLDEIDVMFAQSLMNLKKPKDSEVAFQFTSSSLVYDSRNTLAQRALDTGADYILWTDSDMVFNYDALTTLLDDMAEDKDIITGICHARRPPFTPCIYSKIRIGIDGDSESEHYLDYPEGELFEVDACGFGFVLMKTEVLANVMMQDAFPFSPIRGYGEDITFCVKAKSKGFRIWADSRVHVGHIGKTVVTSDSYKNYQAYEKRLKDAH